MTEWDFLPRLGRRRPERESAMQAFGNPGRKFVIRLAAGAALLAAGTAWAADGDLAAAGRFPLAQVFTILFLMLGPFKIIGPFTRLTQGLDTPLVRQVAVRSTLLAGAALLVAALLGQSILAKYGIPVPVLALSAGILLFLVALQTIFEQYESRVPAPAGGADAPAAGATRLALAVAFPAIVTPYGVAALVVYQAMSQDGQARLTIGAVVVAILLLDLAVMLVARRLLPLLGLALSILGAVLGIVQVALGLQITVNSLRAMGVL